MNYRSIVLVGICIVVISCSPKRKLVTDTFENAGITNSMALCDSLTPLKSLYIKNIQAEISLDEEKYDARLSIYYVRDSIFFISAVNAGFEIVRIGITPDSTVYINRLDKMVFIYKDEDLGYSAPIDFEDIQYLVNKEKPCSERLELIYTNNELSIDRSVMDIRKKIVYSAANLSTMRFEFFHKKTNEYIVGEESVPGEFSLFANFIVENLTIKTSGGVLEMNKFVDVNMRFNVRKYEVLYL